MSRSIGFAPVVRTVLAVAAVVLVAGCPSTHYPDCSKDSDCHAKEFCVNKRCEQCRDAKDCAAGQTCNAGRCENPQTQSCSDDSQCPAGTSCLNGTCTPCKSDSECGDGGKCQAGRCQRGTTTSNNPPTAGPCTLSTVYFDFNESVLSSDAAAAIDKDGDCIRNTPDKRVTLTGHTDPRGTEEYNLALADHRAQSVKDRLTRTGVAASRLKTVSRGELDATGTNDAGWSQDRRVDFGW
jgi:peptidoglycan-associated lipoprotein